jgi:hypothetical protein
MSRAKISGGAAALDVAPDCLAKTPGATRTRQGETAGGGSQVIFPRSLTLEMRSEGRQIDEVLEGGNPPSAGVARRTSTRMTH